MSVRISCVSLSYVVLLTALRMPTCVGKANVGPSGAITVVPAGDPLPSLSGSLQTLFNVHGPLSLENCVPISWEQRRKTYKMRSVHFHLFMY